MTPAELHRLDLRLRTARDAGVELVTLPSLVRRISPLLDLMALISMVRLIRRLRPMIIHTHTSKAGTLGRLAARFCRVPIVVHTPHGHLFYGYYGPTASNLVVRVERWLGRFTDALIVLTHIGKMEYLDRMITTPDQVHAIYSGIELSVFRYVPVVSADTRQACGLPTSGRLIGVLGRLVQIKGHRYLIDALPAILKHEPDTSLVFIGEGDERGRLVDQAKRLGVADHVRLIGVQTDLAQFIAACDLFVQPSLNEGMGRTVLEAMAVGRPVIASRVGGLPELVDHGITGFLVPPMSPSILAEVICTLLSDQKKIEQMGRAARKRVDHRFSADAMVMAIERLYQAIMMKKRVAASSSSVSRLAAGKVTE